MAEASFLIGRRMRVGAHALGCVLCLPLAFAPGAAQAASADADAIHQQGSPFESRRSVRGARTDLSPISLAEPGDGARRADTQAAGTLAVVYPDIGEPYRSVFAKIIEGIEDGARSAVRSYPIAANQDPAELNAQLKRNGTRGVIALGRQGLRATAGLDRDIPVVVGGVLAIPDAENRSLTGISLTPDPALLFARLKSLMPGVKRVIVVYDPQHNEWLIRLAREAARTQGLELAAHEARDMSTAARAYESVFAGSDSRRDAVWLPQDTTTVDENTILPLVLKESWNRSVPVFSSSFVHVKKGALFALYPNNVELGRTLAGSAQALMAGDARRRGLVPLREVQTAVNLRTASHIGLNISFQQQRSFDFIFPEP
ncbi:MAG TPA: ABC transporter substrate binding protein [Noviherbaspirillum sp.]|uniref:ABC transporter substrate-binding protein n=1 Tax=Noviherbaspirillum sp. TaxID=1926288 RepID=UPI002D2DE840|nr:ABC transporter substrate binding protein [Noviherbaspirillum sp.]HYD96496.1 ABC transporter substrate binding protein [Noviherbaspirillum sp.]